MDQFDRDQYPLLLKQFSGLQQSGTVSEYAAEFNRLAHGILLYNPAYDNTYFVTQFVGGLKEDIRSAIALHRPSDVASASALAMLQEDELGKKQRSKPSWRQFTERPKQPDTDKPKHTPARLDQEDKLSSLRDYRRKNNLCFKCGEKWNQHHTCPAKVSLHVIEEILDALSSEESAEAVPNADELEEVISVLSSEAAVSPKRRRTMKLCGLIDNHEVLILVDSGSVGTFISDRIVDQLKLTTVEAVPTKFVAANGSPMICSFRVPHLQWSTKGYSFTSNAGVLPLKCFDMVLDEDWLEKCSPMWVDWVKKVIRFTHKAARTVEAWCHCALYSVQAGTSREPWS
ncbi:unnamed protein product [Miscanthus lutarioriparius]|uniref:Retrotransposon gag domain-containing protein n=1 Tax=Miscanthus lutarioriparius TaxID=422564 RepID=A0A811SM56_9POAL|nr:unnamed protein product [Miscanthus lutarioriparius]